MRFHVIRLLLPFLGTGALLAQTEKATLRGTVTDPSGAVVVGCTVVVTEAETNVEARRALTDTNGTLASGAYFSPAFSGSDPSHTNTVGGLPDCVGNPYSTQQTLSQWFNPAAFAIPPANAGRFGNCGVNVLEGQGIRVLSLSGMKTFRITERIRTTFTAQISNLFNHPHFTFPNNNISNPNPEVFIATVANTMPERTCCRMVALQLRVQW